MVCRAVRQVRREQEAQQRAAGLPGDAYCSAYPLLLPVPLPAEPQEFLPRASELLEEYNQQRAGEGLVGGGRCRRRKPPPLRPPGGEAVLAEQQNACALPRCKLGAH